MEKALVAILIIAIFWVGFCVGNIRLPQKNYDIITVEDAGVILERAIYSHQYYLNYPRENEPIEHHEECIKRYSQIWELIQRLEEK